jgi:hypothetical protein
LLSSDGAADLDRQQVLSTLTGLKPRQFLLQNVHTPRPQVFETRWVLSYLRGPLTREDIRRLSDEETTPPSETTRQPEEQTDEPVTEAVHSGDYLPIRVPGRDDEQLHWRPMAYGAGVVEISSSRYNIDERIDFGFIHGLRGEKNSIDWGESTQVTLDATAFRDRGEPGRHGELDPAAEDSETWEGWEEALIDHVVDTVRAHAYSCRELRLESNPGEDLAAFSARVELAVREERDEAVDKLRSKYERKVERMERSLERARQRLAREEDQAQDAKLKAAVNVGEALWNMFGGRGRRLSTTRATRVVKETRDVERAQQEVDDAVSDLYDLQTEMEAALIDEAEEHQMDDYPIETIDVAPDDRDVEVRRCGLVWVPYWIAPDGSRRRAY